MTAASLPIAQRGVTQARVIRSEWTKLWTVRSTRWSLLAALFGMAALGMIVAAFQMHDWSHLEAADRARYDSRDTAVGGYHLAQLAIGVLGVLVITGEYTTGMIRSSFMAVPHRLPVLWAKALVFAAVTFVLMLVSSFVSFFGVMAIVHQRHVQHSLGDPHALRVVVGAALFLTVLGVLAVGLGGLLRSTAGGIATFVGLLFVLPGIIGILPASIDHALNPYLPLTAGFAVATSTSEGHQLGPWTGFAVFCGYAVIAMVAAAFRMARSDA